MLDLIQQTFTEHLLCSRNCLFSATKRLRDATVSGSTVYNPQDCKGHTSIGSTKKQSKDCACTKEGAINSSGAGGYGNRPPRMKILTNDAGKFP